MSSIMSASFHNLSSSWSTHFSHSRTVTLLRPSSKRSLTSGSLKRFYFFLKRKFLPEPKLPQWDSAHSDRAAILTQFCCADSLLHQMIYLSYLGFSKYAICNCCSFSVQWLVHSATPFSVNHSTSWVFPSRCWKLRLYISWVVRGVVNNDYCICFKFWQYCTKII